MQAHTEIGWVIDLVQRIRALRQERGIATPRERERVRVALDARTQTLTAEAVATLIGELVPATIVVSHENGRQADLESAGTIHASVVIAAAENTEQRDDAARRRLSALSANIERYHVQLADSRFVERAPAAVVDGVRGRLAQAEAEAATLQRALDGDSA